MTKEIIIELDATIKELIYVLSSFDEEQINKIPFEGSWTAAQVGEHLRKSYDGVGAMISGKTKPAERPPDQKVKQIRSDFGDFSIKMTSPHFVLPRNALYNKENLIESLSELKEGIITAASKLDLSEICVAFEFPGYGYLTRLETIHFIIIHTQRHIHQLKKIHQKIRATTNQE